MYTNKIKKTEVLARSHNGVNMSQRCDYGKLDEVLAIPLLQRLMSVWVKHWSLSKQIHTKKNSSWIHKREKKHSHNKIH